MRKRKEGQREERHTYIHTHTHTYIHTRTLTHTHIHTRTLTHPYTYAHTIIHTHTHSLPAHTHTFIHTHTQINTRTHKYTHAHTSYTHICVHYALHCTIQHITAALTNTTPMRPANIAPNPNSTPGQLIVWPRGKRGRQNFNFNNEM